MQVLVVDDHPVIISACRDVLSACDDIAVIDAVDAFSGYEAYVSARPDVVVADINLPGLSGFALSRRILQFDPAARIIVFTMNEDPICVERALENGAKGYIGKSEDPARIVAAIRAVAAGRAFLPPEVAQKLAFLKHSPRSDVLNSLNSRELEILQLLCSGKSAVEIARLINVSYRTVASGCSRLRRKLGANKLTDLVRIAIENRLT
jgi:two-component system, NarL family, invasion response regulator UvrY